MVASFGCLPKARSAAIRFSVEGCVENNLRSAVPENGRMMYIWDIEGEASSGICFPTESSFSSARIIGSAVPSVRTDVASGLNSRVLEIAIRIKPAAIGARKNPPVKTYGLYCARRPTHGYPCRISNGGSDGCRNRTQNSGSPWAPRIIKRTLPTVLWGGSGEGVFVGMLFHNASACRKSFLAR